MNVFSWDYRFWAGQIEFKFRRLNSWNAARNDVVDIAAAAGHADVVIAAGANGPAPAVVDFLIPDGDAHADPGIAANGDADAWQPDAWHAGEWQDWQDWDGAAADGQDPPLQRRRIVRAIRRQVAQEQAADDVEMHVE